MLCASTACTFSVWWCGVFLAFLLQNVLCATTACNFSSVICPDVSAPAALASLLFDPPEPQNTGKTQCFATSLPFHAPASSFFWLSLTCFSLIFFLFLPFSFFFPSLPFLFWLFLLLAIFAFHLSILSEVWILNFLRKLRNNSVNFTFSYTARTTTLHYNYNENVNLSLSLNFATSTVHCKYSHHCITPHHTTLSSCGWGDHCNHSNKHSSSHSSVHVDSLCRPWFAPTNRSYRFPIFETSATTL